MKRIILCFILSLLSNIVFGQENFEGIISYSHDKDYPPSNPIKVYISKSKILIKTITYRGIPKTIYDITNRKIYNVFELDSIIIVSDFEKNNFTKNINLDNSILIQGYRCIKVNHVIPDTYKQYYKKIDAWYSKDLFIDFPDTASFALLQGLFLGKRSISLKTTLEINMPQPIGVKLDNIVGIIATKIIKTKLNDSLFNIPSGFKTLTSEEYNEYLQKSFDNFNEADEKFNIINEKSEAKIEAEKSPPPPLPPPPPPSKPPPYNSKATKKKIVSKTKK